MSRQELADAINTHAYAHTGRRSAADARYVGRLERGEHRWPFEPYRTALLEVLGKATDADLGFFIIQGHARDLEGSPEEPRADADVTADDLGSTATAEQATGEPVAAGPVEVLIAPSHAALISPAALPDGHHLWRPAAAVDGRNVR